MVKMKAGLYVAEKEVAAGELERPHIQSGEALIKVSYSGICGTDMMIYSGKHPRAQAPLAMGHEFSGVIEEINGPSSFSPGDRVVIEPTLSCGVCEACSTGQSHVCRISKLIGIDQHGGFAEYAAVPLNRLHRIPEGLSLAEASLAEPVAVAVHTVRRSVVKVGDNVAILGAGPIGLLIGLMAKQAGAGHILISDISPFRLQKAKELGFTAIDSKKESIVEQINAYTNGIGADVVFEVAGNQTTANQMVEAARIQGQIVVVSVYKYTPTINLAAMHFKEISLITTRCYSSSDFVKATQLMASGKIDVSSLISHTLPLDNISEGFSLMENPDVSLKILLCPEGEAK